jgi:hypothetical protein
MKKELVWLHVGTHKTGTTAIQTGLKSFDNGVTRYARMGSANHTAVMSALFNPKQGQKMLKGRQGIAGHSATLFTAICRKMLLRELSGPAKELVISGESMITFNQDSMQKLADFLTSHTKAVRVLVYVRDPVSYASSALQQRIQGGQSDLSFCIPLFRKRLMTSVKVFGKPAIEVVQFDRGAFGAGGVLADAARRIGIEVPADSTALANESLSSGAIGLLYFWNRTPGALIGSIRRQAARNALIEVLSKAVPGRFRLAPSVARSGIDPADMDWLFRNFNIDFRHCLTSPDAAQTDIFTEADLRAAQDAALPDLIAHMNGIGITNLPPDADAIMDRLFNVMLGKTSRFLPLTKLLGAVLGTP